MPLLRRLADSRCQLVFAEGGSVATVQGADPGLAPELCSSFLDGGQGMEWWAGHGVSTACAGWQERRVPAHPTLLPESCVSPLHLAHRGAQAPPP